MPRSNTPWFRTSKNAWYVTHSGRMVRLGVTGRGNRKQALRAFARLLTGVPDLEGEAGPGRSYGPGSVRAL